MPSVPTGTQPSGWDSGPPGATTAAGWSTVAPASSARGPLHDRQAPPPGGQRAARRHRRPLSGSQRAFQTRGCTPGYPPRNPKSARQRRFLSVADATRFATPESLPRTTIRHRRSVGASWHPPALHGLAYTETPPPAMQVPPPALETGHPGKIPAATPRPLRTPFERFEPTVRLIQKSHPAILAVTGRTTPPVAFYFQNGWLFSPEYAPETACEPATRAHRPGSAAHLSPLSRHRYRQQTARHAPAPQ